MGPPLVLHSSTVFLHLVLHMLDGWGRVGADVEVEWRTRAQASGGHLWHMQGIGVGQVEGYTDIGTALLLLGLFGLGYCLVRTIHAITDKIQGVDMSKEKMTKPVDPAALLAELDAVKEAEAYELTGDGKIVIKVAFFKELITARCKLWALEAEEVSAWDGYSRAMSEPLGDAWLDELE